VGQQRQNLFAEQQNAYRTIYSDEAIWGGGGGGAKHFIALLLIKGYSPSGVPYLSLHIDIFLVLFFPLPYSNTNRGQRILSTVSLYSVAVLKILPHFQSGCWKWKYVEGLESGRVPIFK
jgi:hypothetical protein